MTTFVAKGATATIPIVFVTGSDPVAMGFVASLNQPGGNVTGATFIVSELVPKRVQLLRELLPKAVVVGLLLNPNVPNADPDTTAAQAAARELGLQIHVLRASTIRKLIPPSRRWSN